MKNLLKIEFTKTIYYPTFWAILLLHAFFFFAIIALGANLNINIQGVQIFKLFASTYIWGTTAWIASWFNLLLAIMLIVLVGNELQYNTFRRQILDGLNRNQIIIGKLILIASLSIYVILLVTLTGFTVGLTSGEPWQNGYFHGFRYVLVLGVQSLAYMSLAMLLDPPPTAGRRLKTSGGGKSGWRCLAPHAPAVFAGAACCAASQCSSSAKGSACGGMSPDTGIA